jgi:hypothetical protein
MGGDGSIWQIFNSVLINTELWGVKNSLTIYNLQIQKSLLYGLDQSYGEVEKLVLTNCQNDFYLCGINAVYLNCVTKDTVGYTFDVTVNSNYYHINPTYDKWSFNWRVDAKVFRQYEFDLTTDAGATVTLTDNAGTQVFSVTADAGTGAIATQTVSLGYYDQAHGDTLQSYAPFTLSISGANKETYTDYITFTEKTSLRIMLQPKQVTNQRGTRTITKTIKDPVTTPSLMLNAVLIIKNRKLKKQIKELQLCRNST